MIEIRIKRMIEGLENAIAMADTFGASPSEVFRWKSELWYLERLYAAGQLSWILYR